MAGVNASGVASSFIGPNAPFGKQIIRGKQVPLYSPAWNAAQDEAATHKAAEAGKNAGTSVQALRAVVPDLFGNDTSSSSSTRTSTGSTLPRVGMGAGVGMNTGTGLTGTVPGPASAQTPTLGLTDTSEADAAIFGRARDQVGQTTQAALTGLRSALASRGQLGGGGEFRGTESIIGRGANQLSESIRDRAIENVRGNAERAALKFQGDISMRGQDLSATQAANALAARLAEVEYQGAITQRGQDLAHESNQMTMAQQNKNQQQMILDRILAQLTPLY